MKPHSESGVLCTVFKMDPRVSGFGAESAAGAFDGPPPSQEHQKFVPAFVAKLYEIVDDASCNPVISWTAEGTSFVVLNPDVFQNELLPKYFKHNNFSSFVRQLNLYNFKKLGKPNYWEFKHDFFIRGQPDLLQCIRRKSAPASEQSKAILSVVERLQTENQSLWLELSAQQQRQQGIQETLQKIIVRASVIGTSCF